MTCSTEATDSLPRTRAAARKVGSKFYFTGNPCPRGNIATRLTSAGGCWCDDCRVLHSRRASAWQKKNPASVTAWARAWRENNTEYVKVRSRFYKAKHRTRDRERHLARTYGITQADYLAIMESQEGKCALCRVDPGETPRGLLVVDHCHSSGKVRGLLCDDCNKALGVIEKYRDKVSAMLVYAGQSELTSTRKACGVEDVR